MTATPFGEPRAKRRSRILFRLATLMCGAAIVLPGLAAAQDSSPDAALRPGDGVVTKFSGFMDRERRNLDPDGVVARVLEIETGGAVEADPQELTSLTAAEVGQVFAAEIGGADAPSIYLAASSAYGLHRTEDGADWARGMWGPEGGPGTIWQLVPGGEPAIFATIGSEDLPNRAAGLGDLAYDEAHDRLFVSDLATGMIHALDGKTGEVRQTFDHGVDGRSYFLDVQTGEYLVLDVLPADARHRPNFEDCRTPGGESVAFAAEPSCWGIADFRRRVWGLGVAEDASGDGQRLYYAVWGGAALGSDSWRGATDDARTSIWSVALDRNGNFDLTDVRREVVLPPPTEGAEETSPVVDMAFAGPSTMILAERGRPAPDPQGEPARLVKPDAARLLVLRRDDAGAWSVEGRYDAGGGTGANAAGGVALGAQGGPTGDGAPMAPAGRLWLTVDPLCTAEAPCEGVAANGAAAGLQVKSLSRVEPVDAAGEAPAPQATNVLVLSQGQLAGGLGQVAIYRAGEVELRVAAAPEPQREAPPARTEPTPAEAPAAPQPERVAEPEPAPEPEVAAVARVVLGRTEADLAVEVSAAETCRPGASCGFEVAVGNDGSRAFQGPLVLTGTPGSSGVSFAGAAGDGWSCAASGGVAVCRHPGLELAPGEATRFDVTLRPGDAYGSATLEYCGAVTWLGQDGRDRTRAVQSALQEGGFEPGGVDGAMGPNTTAAIRRAQEARGVQADGRITGELLVGLFGDGAFLEGDAGAENDRACAVAEVDLPPRPEPQPQPQSQQPRPQQEQPQPQRPAHAGEISAFHRTHQSRFHDPRTSTPREMHDAALSRFHQTYGSSLHDSRTSRPQVERRPGGSFHDGSSSRFRAPDRSPGGVQVHELQTSRTLDLHEERQSGFHQTAPSAVHDGRTSRGRMPDRDGPGNSPLRHDRPTSRVVPAY